MTVTNNSTITMAKKIAGRLGLSILGLVVGLVLLEGAVRLALPEPTPDDEFIHPHPSFGWFHIPHKQGWIVGRGSRVRVQINSRGLRDREFAYEKNDGVFRTLVLGDSMVEGLGVPTDDSFPKVLETLLNKEMQDSRLRFEVINAGVIGWGTDQQLVFFQEEGYKYHPDLVLLAFFSGNDVQDNSPKLRRGWSKPFFTLHSGRLKPVTRDLQPGASFLPDTGHQRGEGRPGLFGNPFLWLKAFLEDHSRLYVMFREAMIVKVPGIAKWLMAWGVMDERPVGTERLLQIGVPKRYMVFSAEYDPDWDEAWAVTKALIGQLRRDVESRGARFAVVILTSPEQISAQQRQRARESFPAMKQWECDWEKPDRMLIDFLQQERILHLQLLPRFREYSQKTARDPYLPNDVHYNLEGHHVAARAIYDWLVATGLDER